MFKECSLRLAAFGALAVLILSPVTAGAQSRAPSAHRQTTVAANKVQLEPKAIELLKAVGDRLAAAHTLFFVATETVDRLSRRSEVTLQRPDKVRVSVSGDGSSLESYCSGNTMVTFLPAKKALTIAKAPPTINDCLKDAYQAAALEIPPIVPILADFQRGLIRGLKHASYAGQSALAGETADVVTYSDDNVSMQMWVGIEDKLPRRLHVVYLDDPNRLRRSVAFSDWKIDAPVRPEAFTSLNPGGRDRMDSAEPRPVGTSGAQPAARVRPLTIHTYAAKYWAPGPPAPVGSAYPNSYGAAGYGYYQSPDGYTYYAPTSSAPYPGATAGYYGAPCYDCESEWVNEGAGAETTGDFDLSLFAHTPEWFNRGVPPAYNPPAPVNTTNLTYEPGQIVTTLPVGCAAYTRGAAFYLCGSTWFSGVYGPNGALYFRVISTPSY
jgi:hypothetical protein